MKLDADTTAELDIVIGRLNALHTFCLVIAKTLPAEQAKRAHAALQEATERTVSDMLALPIRDAHRLELQRVLGEMQLVLASSSLGKNKA